MAPRRQSPFWRSVNGSKKSRTKLRDVSNLQTPVILLKSVATPGSVGQLVQQVAFEDLGQQRSAGRFTEWHILAPNVVAAPATAHAKSSAAQEPDGLGMKVIARVRPFTAEEKRREEARGVLHRGSDLLVAKTNSPRQNGKRSSPEKEIEAFHFDHVLGESATQEQVFELTAKPLVDSCLAGHNGTVLAYGQTGSGKTFTMHGSAASDKAVGSSREPRTAALHAGAGLIARTLHYAFERMGEATLRSPSLHFECSCSFVELYNDAFCDLLASAPTTLHLRESPDKTFFLEGLSHHRVASAQEATALLLQGASSRHVASTQMNAGSSRSHSVFTLRVQALRQAGQGDARHAPPQESLLQLVDLAGSERQKSAGLSPARMEEAKRINSSLSALSSVIRMLSRGNSGSSGHVPYRQSPLTALLKSSLGGTSRTVLVACVSPAESCLPETSRTLQFARQARLVRSKPVASESQEERSLSELKMENERLRRENEAMRRRLHELGAASAAPPSQPLSAQPCSRPQWQVAPEASPPSVSKDHCDRALGVAPESPATGQEGGRASGGGGCLRAPRSGGSGVSPVKELFKTLVEEGGAEEGEAEGVWEPEGLSAACHPWFLIVLVWLLTGMEAERLSSEAAATEWLRRQKAEQMLQRVQREKKVAEGEVVMLKQIIEMERTQRREERAFWSPNLLNAGENNRDIASFVAVGEEEFTRNECSENDPILQTLFLETAVCQLE